ncbi:hypothetical protein KY314_03265 [Candidatus Woesearchaeota archaeon]|nr:hypothetical protein [Candidatus Woesearchaeota archaeon]
MPKPRHKKGYSKLHQRSIKKVKEKFNIDKEDKSYKEYLKEKAQKDKFYKEYLEKRAYPNGHKRPIHFDSAKIKKRLSQNKDINKRNF